MANKKNSDIEASAATPTVTQETLDATPERVIKFLRGIGTVPAIRAALSSRGYTSDEHAAGWNLLHEASGFSRGDREFGVVVDPEVSRAVAELDAWDEDGFRIVRAALTRHPEQAKTVLDGIGPSVGPAAVVGVDTLLDRIDALEKSKSAGDHSAMKTLASRGITTEERKRLRALIATAKKGTAQAPAAPSEDEAAAATRHQGALVALRAWYEEWSEMAKAVIKRRDRLIRLGLAKRKSTRKSTTTATPPAAAATVSAAP